MVGNMYIRKLRHYNYWFMLLSLLNVLFFGLLFGSSLIIMFLFPISFAIHLGFVYQHLSLRRQSSTEAMRQYLNQRLKEIDYRLKEHYDEKQKSYIENAEFKRLQDEYLEIKNMISALNRKYTLHNYEDYYKLITAMGGYLSIDVDQLYQEKLDRGDV